MTFCLTRNSKSPAPTVGWKLCTLEWNQQYCYNSKLPSSTRAEFPWLWSTCSWSFRYTESYSRSSPTNNATTKHSSMVQIPPSYFWKWKWINNNWLVAYFVDKRLRRIISFCLFKKLFKLVKIGKKLLSLGINATEPKIWINNRFLLIVNLHEFINLELVVRIHTLEEVWDFCQIVKYCFIPSAQHPWQVEINNVYL